MTANPPRNQAVSPIIAAFTTSRNRPSVTMVSGRVRMTMIGRTMALTRPSRTAAATRLPVEVKSTPGTIWAASHRPRAVTTA
ncbi:hypothetical protein D3C80_1495750 [compost metagenome]